MSFFEKLTLLPPDPILGLPVAFAADPREKKVNLGVGSYKDKKGHPFVLSVIKQAEKLLYDQNLNKEYQSIEGNPDFLHGTFQLVYGNEQLKEKTSVIQAVGGTSALCLAAEFFFQQGHRTIYLSDPTWANHRNIFQRHGMNIQTYPYYDYKTGGLLFEAWCESLEKMPVASVVLLHADCHNPTGMDPSHEQWKKISEIIKRKRLTPFFDLAYQGLGAGLEEDVWSIRHFVNQGHELFVAISYSKNMGLYGERVGALSWFTPYKDVNQRLLSHFKQIVRSIYSNPPLHGGRLAGTVLSSKVLKNEWIDELAQMRFHIEEMRKLFIVKMKAKNFDFKFMEAQKGMFTLMNLSPAQVDYLKKEYAIYLPTSGRISLPGLTDANIDYVTESLATVLKKT